MPRSRDPLLLRDGHGVTLRSDSSTMTLLDGKAALDYVDARGARVFSETWTGRSRQARPPDGAARLRANRPFDAYLARRAAGDRP
jgi:hypothetical protein